MDLLASHAMKDPLVDPEFEMTEEKKQARAALAAKEAKAAQRQSAKVEEARLRAEQRALRPPQPKKQKAVVVRAATVEESDEEMNEPILDLHNLPPLPDLVGPRSASRQSSESNEGGDVNRRRSFASFLNSQANSQVDPPVVSPPRTSDSDDSSEVEDNTMIGGDGSDSSE